jgi:sialate O-acetylesterase
LSFSLSKVASCLTLLADDGKRLGLTAEALVYGKAVEFTGPLYEKMRVEGNTARLYFTHLGGGLTTKDGGRLKGFAIAGKDRQFRWGNATVESDTIIVRSGEVAAPLAIRYAWGDDPPNNLLNRAGLPAIPFRTDDWPGITVREHRDRP